MCQNPSNAIVHLGHASGTVTLWSPNVQEPLVKLLCHQSVLKSLAVSRDGNYMATSGLDHLLNIYDLRTYKPLRSLKLKSGAAHMAFSDTGCLAVGMRNELLVLRGDQLLQQGGEEVVEVLGERQVYLRHCLRNVGSVENVQFCPYEDVLGVGHGQGVTSVLVPGAGEANFDALEANPYESKGQRRQWEVKALLEKVQPELISLDPMQMGRVDKKSLEEKMVERNKKLVGDWTQVFMHGGLD